MCIAAQLEQQRATAEAQQRAAVKADESEVLQLREALGASEARVRQLDDELAALRMLLDRAQVTGRSRTCASRGRGAVCARRFGTRRVTQTTRACARRRGPRATDGGALEQLGRSGLYRVSYLLTALLLQQPRRQRQRSRSLRRLRHEQRRCLIVLAARGRWLNVGGALPACAGDAQRTLEVLLPLQQELRDRATELEIANERTEKLRCACRTAAAQRRCEHSAHAPFHRSRLEQLERLQNTAQDTGSQR